MNSKSAFLFGGTWMIELKKVMKSYADKLLFKDVDLAIYDGERVGIVGENGSGKTTLMRILCGDELPDGGQVKSSSNGIGYLKQITAYRAEDFIKISQDPEFVREFLTIKSKLHITDDIDFSPDRLANLSGGEKTKLMLASILSCQPDTLLLDEPTNHLDADGIEWLIETINEYDGTVIVISHDRYFLNNVATRIVEVENGQVNFYYGNYDDYEREKEQELSLMKDKYQSQIALEKKIDRQIRQLNEWSSKAEKSSRRQGGMLSDSKLCGAQTKAQVSSAKLASMAKAKKAKLEQAKEDFIEKPYESGEIFYRLESKPIGSKVLIKAEGLSKSFGDKVLFEDVDFMIMAGEKVALRGANGSGKSTLIKMIMGEEEYKGSIWKAPSLKIAYLTQDVLDLDPNKTVMEISQNGDHEYRTKFLTNLANMNMSRQVFNRKISTLSMGERMRIKMNELILSDFNFLILDEPTNHLDLPNRVFMEQILKDYKGGLLLVSHDKTFCQNICTSSLDFEDKTIKK